MATRYDQTAASYLACVSIAALRIWTKYVHAAKEDREDQADDGQRSGGEGEAASEEDPHDGS